MKVHWCSSGTYRWYRIRMILCSSSCFPILCLISRTTSTFRSFLTPSPSRSSSYCRWCLWSGLSSCSCWRSAHASLRSIISEDLCPSSILLFYSPKRIWIFRVTGSFSSTHWFGSLCLLWFYLFTRFLWLGIAFFADFLSVFAWSFRYPLEYAWDGAFPLLKIVLASQAPFFLLVFHFLLYYWPIRGLLC